MVSENAKVIFNNFRNFNPSLKEIDWDKYFFQKKPFPIVTILFAKRLIELKSELKNRKTERCEDFIYRYLKVF